MVSEILILMPRLGMGDPFRIPIVTFLFTLLSAQDGN